MKSNILSSVMKHLTFIPLVNQFSFFDYVTSWPVDICYDL